MFAASRAVGDGFEEKSMALRRRAEYSFLSSSLPKRKNLPFAKRDVAIEGDEESDVGNDDKERDRTDRRDRRT